MKSYTKKLLLAFIILVVIKIVFSAFILAPSMFNDEYLYAKKAQSFLSNGNFLVHGQEFPYSFVYPVFISIAYIAKDMSVVFFLMKLINVLLSTLIIVPAWLLAREFLDEKKAFMASLLVSCLPGVFAFSGFILSENLFYTTFLFSVYFIYKSFTSQKYYFGILAGVFIALSSLVKNTGLVLLLLPLAGYAANAVFSKESIFTRTNLKKILVLYIAAIAIFAIILPFTAETQPFGYLASSDMSDVTAVVRHNSYFIPLISWFAIYLGFLMLSSGVLLGVLSFFPLKETAKNLKLFAFLSWFAIGLVLFVGANHAAGGPVVYGPFSWFTERPIGRYVDIVTPLIIILGVIGFEAYEKRKLYGSLNKGLILCSLLLVWASQLNFTSLFPVNNLPLTHFGVLKMAVESLIYGANSLPFSWSVVLIMLISFIALPVLFIILNLKRKLNFSKVLFALMAYFLIVGCIVYAVAGYNSYRYWYSGEQMELGRWMGDNLDDKITLFIDEKECSGGVDKTGQAALCDSTHLFAPTGFFITNPILISNRANLPDEAYLLSSREIDNAILLKQTENYFVYRFKS